MGMKKIPKSECERTQCPSPQLSRATAGSLSGLNKSKLRLYCQTLYDCTRNAPPRQATRKVIPKSNSLRQYLLFGQEGSFFAVELVAVREVLPSREQPVSAGSQHTAVSAGTDLPCAVKSWPWGISVARLGTRRLTHKMPAVASRLLEVPAPQDARLGTMRMVLAVSHVGGVIARNQDQIVSAVEVSE